MAERLILITNDDGVNASGLLALKKALERVARVEVYAPDRNWSAASRTRTFHKPLRVDEVRLLDGSRGFATSGTPSDCVSLALLGLLKRLPDLIVSGINDGLNVGRDVSYSGTVAAAMEGVRAGVPAIAVSFDTSSDRSEVPDYTTSAEVAARLAALLLDQQKLPENIVLNVNVPYSPAGRKLETRITRLGGDSYSNYLVTGKDPQGRNFYWISGDPLTKGSTEEESTDIGAISAGFVSVTPIHLDMTEHELLEQLEGWLPNLNSS